MIIPDESATGDFIYDETARYYWEILILIFHIQEKEKEFKYDMKYEWRP